MISWLIDTSILAPALVSFAAAVALHIALTRLLPRAEMMRVLCGSLVAGALLCITVLWLRQRGEAPPSWLIDNAAIVAVYCALAYIYGDLYGFNLTSIRLQALRCIHRLGVSATRDDLVQACGSKATVNRRLAQYVRSKDLSLADGRYRLSRSRILYITRGFRILRRMLLGTRTGSA